MRIDAFNSGNEIIAERSSRQITSNPWTTGAMRDTDDRATLTAESVSIRSLAAKALGNPAMRQDRIDALRQAINTGQYLLDPAKIAGSIVDESA